MDPAVATIVAAVIGAAATILTSWSRGHARQRRRPGAYLRDDERARRGQAEVSEIHPDDPR